MQKNPEYIRAEFRQMREDGKARHRDIAEKLEISEGEMIAAHVSDAMPQRLYELCSVRLIPKWADIFSSLESLGEVMALTRNASCVHERKGTYKNFSQQGNIGLVLGEEIDLRIFFEHWAHGFAVRELTPDRIQHSLQFFDASGTAIHKIFFQAADSERSLASFLQRFADQVQFRHWNAAPHPHRHPIRSDESIDIKGFQTDWERLRDTHDFTNLLKKYSVGRLQGLRIADHRFAQRVDPASAYQLLDGAAQSQVPVMVFVGNTGVIQIHSGEIKKVAVMGPWLNVLDSKFNLHLREDHIDSAWVVRKPTLDGLITSLELFNSDGDVIAMFFGKRKPGKSELCEWRNLIDTLLVEEKPWLN